MEKSSALQDKLDEQIKNNKPFQNIVEIITCNKCQKVCPMKGSRCSACKRVFYCGVDCQRGDWPSHKKVCKQLAAQAKIQEQIEEEKEEEVPETPLSSTFQMLRKCNYDTNQEWSVLKKHIRVEKIGQIQDPNVEKQPGYLRFVCLSDTHLVDECFYNVPKGDVLIHAGDFTQCGSKREVEKFVEQLNSLDHPTKIVIAGNHEQSFDLIKWDLDGGYLKSKCGLEDVDDPVELKEMVIKSCTHYLEDSGVAGVGGYKIWGSPWTPYFGGMGFNAQRGEEIRPKWKCIPTDTDILITHGPPLGIGDSGGDGGGTHVGCTDLLDTVQNRVKPMYHIFGHTHSSYGIYSDGTTTYINAANVDSSYKCKNPPIVFDLEIKE